MNNIIDTNTDTDTHIIPLSIVSLLKNQNVRVRARIYKIRVQAQIIFLILRQENETIQCVYLKNTHNENDDLLNIIINTPRESVVEITGTVKKSNIKSCSIQDVEIDIISVVVISLSQLQLPIQIDEKICLSKQSEISARLNNRVLDLRRISNQFIFRLKSTIVRYIRDFFDSDNFIEIHTPKLVPNTIEKTFNVKYFKQQANLIDSPQMYKQMVMCSDFTKVYEIGTVFRNIKDDMLLNLTEFTAIDMEMVFENGYEDMYVMLNGLFSDLFVKLKNFHGVTINHFLDNLEVTKFEFCYPLLRITYKEAIVLLRNYGIEISDYEDFSVLNIKILNYLIKKKYNMDVFIVEQFPTCITPFYAKPNSSDPLYSNSYNIYMRGIEVLSGSQHINNYDELVTAAVSRGIDLSQISDYLNATKYGTLMYGGACIGLERVIMSYLGIEDIHNVSLFPRDSKRLYP